MKYLRPIPELLLESEVNTVRCCLRAAVEGPFFPDWEFETLIGVDRQVVREVLSEWPLRTVSQDEFVCAVLGSMSNLIGYPHGMDSEFLGFVHEGRAAVKIIIEKLIANGY